MSVRVRALLAVALGDSRREERQTMASKYARRHYEDVAQVAAGNRELLAKSIANGDEVTAEQMCLWFEIDMARLFEDDNPLFDRSRFYKAARG